MSVRQKKRKDLYRKTRNARSKKMSIHDRVKVLAELLNLKSEVKIGR